MSNQTHLCGTIRKKRKHFPKDLARAHANKGESVFHKHVDGHSMVAAKYRSLKDKASKQPKIVFMLSTCHDAVSKHTEKVDHSSGLENIKPLMTIDYDKHMGGVDRVNQQLHSLRIIRKSYKWNKKLVFRLGGQMILNAHKVYQKVTTNTDVSFLQFLCDVIVQLVTQLPAIGNPQHGLDDTFSCLTGRHFPHLKKAAPGVKDQRPTKPCHMCTARNIRSAKCKPPKTVYICAECLSGPGLHPEPCFEIYHTVFDYSVQK